VTAKDHQQWRGYGFQRRLSDWECQGKLVALGQPGACHRADDPRAYFIAAATNGPGAPGRLSGSAGAPGEAITESA
jgi:hypothetical protein